MLSEREAIEVFHLLFLRAFGARVGKDLYALKGGCNLRFFFKSIRYSEDIDLDIRTISVATLRKNVDQVLASRSFLDTLRAQRIDLEQISKPKQTETTQRWKVGLRVSPTGPTLPTKIEFSRRGVEGAMAHESVDAELIRRYRLYPVIVQHYVGTAAFAQKIVALAKRSQTQARDVFDLNLLLDSGVKAAEDTALLVPQAMENMLTVGYDEFAGQVLAYLEPEYQDHFRPRRVWEDLQERVINALNTLQS